jgi:hypothetical protein
MDNEMFFTPLPGLQEFGKNIWIVEGPRVLDMGIWFTTRMTIVKLSNGTLWINSPVPTSFDILRQISKLGSVKYLVAATPRHVWRLDSWHTLFPEAQMWVTRKTAYTLAKGKLSFTGFLKDELFEDWKEDLDQVLFKGSSSIEEGFFFHKPSNTLILDDMIQIHSREPGQPFLNALMNLDGVAAPFGGVGIDIRLSFGDKKLAQKSLEKVLAWNFDKLIMAHGPCIIKDAKSIVERAFGWLTHRKGNFYISK